MASHLGVPPTSFNLFHKKEEQPEGGISFGGPHPSSEIGDGHGNRAIDAMVTVFESDRHVEGEPVRVQSLEDVADLSLNSILSLQTFFNNYRSNANFESTDFMVADDDSGTPVEDVIKRHRDHACIILTTRHHQIPKRTKSGVKPACDRTRIIFQTSESVTDLSVFKYNYSLLHKKFPMLDTSVTDAARILYKANNLVFINSSGIPLQIAKPPNTGTPELETVKHPEISSERGFLTGRTIKFLNYWGIDTKLIWHQEFIFAVQDIKAQNYTYEECKDLLSSITGFLDSEDLGQLRDIWKKRTNFKMNFRKKKELRSKV